MAIADTITSMQTHTSNAYTMIGYGTDLTGTNKNLENLSTSIFNAFLEALRTPDTLFNNLPKITGSGSNITLNDTANAPMRIELGASELSQSGTPTPSSPQDIHTISGDNTIKVEGKNILNFTSLRQYVCDVKSGDSYTITYKGTGTDGQNIYLRTYAGEYVSGLDSFTNEVSFLANGTEQTATITSTIDGILYLRSGASAGSFTTDYIQIEKGTTATTYTSYVSQEANIDLTTGTNLFNVKSFEEQLVSGKILNDSGVETNDSTSTYSKYKIPVKKNITIYIKGWFQRIYYYDENGNFVSRSSADNNLKSFAYTPTTNGYIGFQISNTIWASNKGQEMINLGNVALTYVPYADIEYCKIGNYEDKFIRNSGKNILDRSACIEDKILTWAAGAEFNETNAITSEYIRVSSGDTFISNYTMVVFFYRQDKTYIGFYVSGTITTSGSGSPVRTFTIPNDNSVYYMRVVYRPGYNDSSNMKNLNIMLNTGTTLLEYEPYGTNEWYIKKNIGKVVLDGTNYTITSFEAQYNNRCRVVNIDNFKIGSYNTQTSLLTHFNFDSSVYADSQDNIGYCNRNNGNGIFIRFGSQSTITNATLANTWLSENLPILYYVLDTPTYTKITGTLAEQLENVYKKMLSQTGQTNISQVNNDLSFVINASAIESVVM